MLILCGLRQAADCNNVSVNAAIKLFAYLLIYLLTYLQAMLVSTVTLQYSTPLPTKLLQSAH